MKVTREELNNYGLLQSLPQPLKDMGAGEYFVFFYNVDEDNAKLIVYKTQIVKEVNISLYRDSRDVAIQEKINSVRVGFFSNTFESRDGLFYQFLRTYNNLDAVKTFYSFLVEQDKIVDINVSTDSINTIQTSEDFRRAISYFSNSRLQSIMFVYDMVNNAVQRRLSKNLYGDMIKKIVNLVVFEGGVLPEIGGKMRFMVIGENAKLTDKQKEKLKEAKILIRSMQSPDKVYQHTGWALSQKDGKWRTNIADNKAEISKALLFDYQGKKIYVPNGQTIEQVLPIIENPQRAINQSYRGRLVEVFKHPTLYDYYPKLALMPLVYFYGDTSSSEDFYFSPDDRGGYIVINGSKQSGDSLSILLHEIQHYIQHQEGFATGGNLFLAQFVASVGSNAVRRIFACINKMERYFREYLFDDDSRIELLDVIRQTTPKSNSAKQIRGSIIEMLNDREDYRFKYKTINFYLVLFVAEEGDFTTSDVIDFFESKFGSSGSIIYELFENISEGYKQSKKYREKLLSVEGGAYRESDVSTILFKGYENLYGEMESRSVQSSRYVESELKNYFYITTWETRFKTQQLTVIDDAEEILELDKINAAVEKKGDEYVLHFKKEKTCVPFLHELAHIVHDCLNKLGYENIIKKEYDKDLFSDDIDEYFVNKFLGYIKNTVDDSEILKDMKYDLSLTGNQEINKILDEFFTDQSVSERLKFLQSILSL
jgi:hypothetical protein